MNDEMNMVEAEVGGSRQLSRRTVLRTAAHAAWAVPVISAVSAAPAFAAASDVLVVSYGTPTWPDADKKRLLVPITVTNTAPGDLDAYGLTADLTVTSTPAPTGSPAIALLSGSAWSLTTVSPIRLECGFIADGDPSPFTLQLKWSGNNLSGVVQIRGKVKTTSDFNHPDAGVDVSLDIAVP